MIEQVKVKPPESIPPFLQEHGSGVKRLRPEEERHIVLGTRRIACALISSIADRQDVPRRSGVACALVTMGVEAYLTRQDVPFPDPADQHLLHTLYGRMLAAMAAHGHRLPCQVQEMLMWQFLPHEVCAAHGRHPYANHFMHLWERLFRSWCSRRLQQLRPGLINVGDRLRDGLPVDVKTSIANLSRQIATCHTHLLQFMDGVEDLNAARYARFRAG